MSHLAPTGGVASSQYVHVVDCKVHTLLAQVGLSHQNNERSGTKNADPLRRSCWSQLGIYGGLLLMQDQSEQCATFDPLKTITKCVPSL